MTTPILWFQVEFEEPHGPSAADRTWGSLTAWLAGSPAWRVRWTLVDVLEWLADRWVWLVHEQSWPPQVSVDRLAAFDVDAQRALEELSGPLRLKVESSLFDFRDRHDLSRALQGCVAPPFWFVRQGHSGWVSGGGRNVRVPFESALDAFRNLGETIARRLGVSPDDRALEVLRWWEGRDVR